MKKSFFLLAFFPLFCYADLEPTPGVEGENQYLGDNEENFALIKANCSQYIVYACTNIDYAIRDIYAVDEQLVSELTYWQQRAANAGSSSFTDGYSRGGAAAAGNMYTEWDGYKQDKLFQLQFAKSNLQNAQQQLSRLNFVTTGNYSNVLEFIATNQFHFANNATNALFACISNLFTISQLCQDSLPDLHEFLETILPELDGAWANIVDFFDYATDVEDTFVRFFDLAADRLDKPQEDLQYALAYAWNETILHFSEILRGAGSNNTYRTQRPLFTLRSLISSDDVQLSNEGWILAESLQAQTWSYLVEVEILNELKRMQSDSFPSNNTENTLEAELESIKTNLFLIMQHQTICQEPFFQLFNSTVFPKSSESYNPYNSTIYQPLTNFLSLARNLSSSNIKLRQARRDYRQADSNWFSRVETQLLLLNGLIPLGEGLDTDRYDEENLDKDTNERRIRYSTNSVNELVVSISDVSNKLTRVFDKYKELLDEFKLPEGHGGGEAGGQFISLPTLSLGLDNDGDIEMEFEPITWDDLHDIVEPVRICTKLLWYFIFGFLSYRLVLTAVYLFGRLVAHVTLVISTLIS